MMHSSGDDSPDPLDSDYAFSFSNGGSTHHNDNNNHHHNPSSSSSSTSNSIIINSTGLKHTSWLFQAPLFFQWTPIHHFLYQLSQLVILILIITNLNKRQRFLIVLYSVSHCLYGYFVLKSIDVFIWGIVLFVFNLLSGLWSLCVEWPLRFSADYEQVYKKLFMPLKVSRRQFKKVLDCKRQIKILQHGDHYAVEKCSRVDSLALLLSGRLLVSQNSKPLHVISSLQFVDSPEYFGVSTDELFQVTITAIEDSFGLKQDSKLIVWHRDKLRLTIMTDDFLRTIFDHVIGRDVVRKLIQVSDAVTATTLNGTAPSGGKEPDDFINENDPMLDIKTGNNNSTEIWSLTKIAEEETPV